MLPAAGLRRPIHSGGHDGIGNPGKTLARAGHHLPTVAARAGHRHQITHVGRGRQRQHVRRIVCQQILAGRRRRLARARHRIPRCRRQIRQARAVAGKNAVGKVAGKHVRRVGQQQSTRVVGLHQRGFGVLRAIGFRRDRVGQTGFRRRGARRLGRQRRRGRQAVGDTRGHKTVGRRNHRRIRQTAEVQIRQARAVAGERAGERDARRIIRYHAGGQLRQRNGAGDVGGGHGTGAARRYGRPGSGGINGIRRGRDGLARIQRAERVGAIGAHGEAQPIAGAGELTAKIQRGGEEAVAHRHAVVRQAGNGGHPAAVIERKAQVVSAGGRLRAGIEPALIGERRALGDEVIATGDHGQCDKQSFHSRFHSFKSYWLPAPRSI